MPRITDSDKQRGVERVWLTVKRNPNGISEAEIERFTGIQRRTANNYLNELRDEGKIDKEGTLWFALDYEETRLRVLDLSPEEAYALYLGSRLLVKQHDKRNEPAEAALLKLAEALSADAGVGNEIAQAAHELAQRPTRSGYQSVFTTMVRGYIYRKRVAIRYRPLNGRSFETTFETYLMEPSAIGFATYAIGRSSLPDALRAYKIERIEEASLTRSSYAMPADFPGLDILRHSWSIIMGEDTVEVVLRFSPRVKERVLETQWHPSQQVADDPDKPGYLRWQVRVADTTDMLPWIRGWGADVEVLAPGEVREGIEQEVHRMAETYRLTTVGRQFVAHIREKDKKRQPLLAHLLAVSNFAGRFAGKIGLEDTGTVLGFLHDLGKANDLFQTYILSGEGEIAPDAEEYIDPVAHKGKIDHTTAGAQVVYEKLWHQGPKERVAAQTLALCIASHHSGLIDCLTPSGENGFRKRMEKPDDETRKSESCANLHEIHGPFEDMISPSVVEQVFSKLKGLKEDADETHAVSIFKAGLLIRYLLSCLLDADRLDTADFEMPGNAELRNYGQYQSWQTLIQRLDQRLASFENKPNRNEVDELRDYVSEACLTAAANSRGIYQLTVPTGGGKTLSSLRFALHHAAQHGLDRIVYVIPYTSIIDQNAHEIRQILENRDQQGRYLDQVVLEHHSNLTPEEESRRQNLLAQNWDAPIVLTTQVQFIEALFGSGTRSARRMHQLAKSVIILDEVQTIPVKTVHLLNLALRFLVHDCGASVVLCTATQPPLDQLDAQSRSLVIEPDKRIIKDEHALYARLNRVKVHDARKVGGWSEKEVADLAEGQLHETDSVLVVVNTRRAARALFDELDAKRIAGLHLYHLSTNMCAVHRLKVLDQIKARLTSHEPVICVSTQLIEAGVDIDFGAVIRYLAGLDSIAQSAGRCNRHGLRPDLGNVWIVNPQVQNLANLEAIAIGSQLAERVLDDFKSDPARFGHERIGIEAMADYYRYYYYVRKAEMDYPVERDSPVGRDDTLFNLLAANTHAANDHFRANQARPDLVFPQSFRTASRLFGVIDSPTRGVIVPYGKEGEEIVAALCAGVDPSQVSRWLRKAQRYSVNLFAYEFDRLTKAGAIVETRPGTGLYYLEGGFYSDKFGWSNELTMDVESLVV